MELASDLWKRLRRNGDTSLAAQLLALDGDALMESLTRREGKDLRRLAGVAYDRELARELTRLEASFAEWHAGRLTAHDVSAAIHAFHDGVARDLWVLYNRIDPASTVPRAVVTGLLTEGEVPAPLLAKLQKALEYFRQEAARSASEPPAV